MDLTFLNFLKRKPKCKHWWHRITRWQDDKIAEQYWQCYNCRLIGEDAETRMMDRIFGS